MRVTIDLTDAAAAEVKRLCDKTGLSTADLFRNALSLFRESVRWKCPKCGEKMQTFTADLDICTECGHQRPGE